jgi:hypothetical protein
VRSVGGRAHGSGGGAGALAGGSVSGGVIPAGTPWRRRTGAEIYGPNEALMARISPIVRRSRTMLGRNGEGMVNMGAE